MSFSKQFGTATGPGVSVGHTPKSQLIACDAAAEVSGVEETLTAGTSSLTYDPLADVYIYAWKTNKTWAGTCRQLVRGLGGGTFERANFKFKEVRLASQFRSECESG